jgi:hypothetical protein
MKTKKITAADGTVYELPQSNIDIATIQAMIDTAIRAEREREHPVGSLWIREVDIDPAIYFGFGTWVRVEGRMILGASAEYPAGTTGGSATHKHATEGHILTVLEMPSHKHDSRYISNTAGNAVAGMKDAATAHWWSEDYIGSTGGDQPHDHGDTTDGSSMPPYIAVYIWQRVA